MDIQQLPPLPYDLPNLLLEKASKIELALFDVDGVLTDGSLHYSEAGEQVKSFHALDGHGLKMLHAANIQVGIISARRSSALKRRLSDLEIQHQHLGAHNKSDVLKALLSDLSLNPEQCCFTGDDVIDLPVMQECGLAFSVNNAHFLVKHHADWVTPEAGGAGAVRAICDVLLYAHGDYPLGHSFQQ